MRQAAFSEAQIVDILAEAARGEMTAGDVCNLHGMSEQASQRWKRKHGEMATTETTWTCELEAENAWPKRLLVDSAVEVDAIWDASTEDERRAGTAAGRERLGEQRTLDHSCLQSLQQLMLLVRLRIRAVCDVEVVERTKGIRGRGRAGATAGCTRSCTAKGSS